VLGKRNVQDRHEHRKLHYQCLEQMVLSRERAIQSLRRQLETVNTQYVFLSISSILQLEEIVIELMFLYYSHHV